jgi:hypothetical protein
LDKDVKGLSKSTEEGTDVNVMTEGEDIQIMTDYSGTECERPIMTLAFHIYAFACHLWK